MVLYFTLPALAGWVVKDWMPDILKEKFRLGQGQAGVSAVLYVQLASLVGVGLGGWLADRWMQRSDRGRIYVSAVGMSFFLPALFGVGNAATLPVAIGFLLLFGLGWGFFDCNNMPILCQIVRAELRATGYGFMNLVSISCGGFADWGFGALRDRHVPLNVIFGVFASLALLSVLIVLLIRPGRKRCQEPFPESTGAATPGIIGGVRLICDLQNLAGELRSGAVAIGNFDGVHRGHARIVAQLRVRAAAVNGPAVVFTFDPHPVRLLRPTLAPPPLTWTERKAQLLAQLGVDAIIAYPTDEALLRLSPQEFFDRIVRDQLDARALVEGPNFCFGRDRAGNIEGLERMCRASGILLEVVEPLVEGDALVSSSRVRQLIAGGFVREAKQLLTGPYRIRGMVTHGARRGGKLGFPTANVNAIDTLLPRQAVYAGRAFLGSESWPAAIHIGPNPTFGDSAQKVEVHLIGFDRSIYGEPLEVDFLDRLREIQPFASVDDLVQQLARDIEAARTIAGRGES